MSEFAEVERDEMAVQFVPCQTGSSTSPERGTSSSRSSEIDLLLAI
jgi:hypothetical protein